MNDTELSYQQLENEIEKLKEKNTLLDNFLKAYSSAYSVNIKDDTFEILHMTHAFRQVFTMDGDRNDMARFIGEHVHPDDRDTVRLMTDRNYIKERLKTEREISFSIREQYDGNERTMRALIMRGSDEDHVAVGFMDVTDELQKEKEINRKLKAAALAKDAFLFNISHDILTPMNAIIGFNNMAKSHIDDRDTVMNCINKIGMSSKYLLTLINDALEMARIESGQLTVEEAPLCLSVSVNELIEMIKDSNVKSISIEGNFSGIEHNYVFADKFRLNIILSNIISNSIKYTEEGGKVSFSVKERDPEKPGYRTYDFTVTDNGIGMSQEFIDHIFEPFAREKNSTVSGIPGAGLGMAISKSIIDMLDGSISIESQPGHGTKTTVTLSFKEDPTDRFDSGYEPDRPVDISVLRGKHALIVEDNELNAEITCDILREYGMDVELAENGEIAVEKYRSAMSAGGDKDYDIILMDIQMPVMDGYKATRVIRSLMSDSEKRVPIVALTANTFPEDKQKARDCGMDAHLAKPIDTKLLEKALTTLINR